MRYFLYARKSTESEDRQVQSINDQLTALRRLAVQRGLRVIEEMVESKSAKDPGARPVFAHLLAEIEAGKAEGILCWNLNRLSRNPVDSGTLSWMLQRGAIQSILTVEREYRPEDNVVLMAVESGVANQFILDLRKAVARGTRSKIEKGWFPHRAPEGYRNNIIEKTIEADGERFALLRDAWGMMLTGAYTVPQIQDELTLRGFRTKKTRRSGGRPISRSALYRVFANPFYAGEFVHEGQLVTGAHPRMIGRHEFERVQRLLGRDGHPQPQKLEWAFTGLIRCGLCGHAVTAERKVKRYKGSGAECEYAYYHCAGRHCRPKVSISESQIEEVIASLLECCTLNPDVAGWCLDAWDRHEDEQGGTDLAAQEQAREALRTAVRRRDRLFDMREGEEITRDEYVERRGRLDVEIEGLTAAQEDLRGKAARDLETVRNLLDFCTSAYARFAEGDVRSKREVAYALGGQLALTLGTLDIEPHPLLAVIRSLEPLERGSGKQKQGTSALSNPTWWTMRDGFRRVLDAGNPPFFYLGRSP